MPQEILNATEEKMKKTLEVFTDELKTVRTGRPNPEIFKKVKVECYGMSMPIMDTAAITVPDGQSFLVSPFDKGNLKAIEDAISTSDLGLTPNNDGDNIRINIPPLSKERREEMAKKVGKIAEDRGKIPLRSVRQTAKDEIKELDKQGGISEDVIKKANEDLEKLTSKYNSKIEEETQKKEQELMKV